MVEGLGEFRVESMLASGPMELFYYKKIFSRLSANADLPFWLIVPNQAILGRAFSLAIWPTIWATADT